MRIWPIVLLSFAVGCATKVPVQQRALPRHAPSTKSATAVVPEKKIINEALIKRLKEADAVVLDVRTLEEYVNGHVVGAKHIDFLRSDFEKAVSKLDRRKHYYLYCASGNRAGKALQYLLARGVKAETIDAYDTLKSEGLATEGLSP